MATLPDDRDSPGEVMRRAAQQDPWVMYLVVRQDVPASAADVLLAAAQATMRCVAAHAGSPTWADAFRAWSERSFRKVTLRARASAWTRLEGYDAGVGHAGGIELVRALPPRLRSACDAFLRNLQVYNPDPASLAPAAADPPAPSAMNFVLNPRATMSLGKQAAQVAHAVLMCAWSPAARDPRRAPAFDAWRDAGFPGRLAPSERWARARAMPGAVVVRDAGLTEVEPGTETVVALPPGDAP